MWCVQVLVPSLEELQAVVSQVVQCVTDIGQSIPCWTAPTQHSSPSEHQMPLQQHPMHRVALCTSFYHVAKPVLTGNYHRAIHDSKELLKLTSLLSSALLACRQDLMKVHVHTMSL